MASHKIFYGKFNSPERRDFLQLNSVISQGLQLCPQLWFLIMSPPSFHQRSLQGFSALAQFQHLGWDNTLLLRTMLCIVGCLATSLASSHQMPVVPPTHLWQPTMSPDIVYCSLGGKNHSHLRTTELPPYFQKVLQQTLKTELILIDLLGAGH